MGVYENQPAHRAGMHWPQPERQQPCVQHAYDPSRDLSPNLPHHHHHHHHPPHLHEATRLPCDRLDPFNNNNSSSANNNNHERPASALSGSVPTPLMSCDDDQGCHQCNHHHHHHHHQGPPPGATTPSSASCPSAGVVVPPASSSSSCSSSTSTTPTLVRPKQERACSPASDGAATTTELEAAGPCAGCGRRIADRFYLLAVDRRWHAACLQCCSCRHALDGEVTCFSRDGNIYCKTDYYRLFGAKRCARCQAAISSSELVMRARELVFHLHCFTCALCHTPLAKGDHFGLRDGAVLCRLHYEAPASHSPTPAFPPPASGEGPCFSPGAPPGAPYRAVPPSPQGLSPGGGGPPVGLSGSLPPGAAMMPLGPHAGPHGPHGPHAGLAPMPHMGMADPKLPFFNGGLPPAVAAPPRQKGRPRKRKPKEMEAITGGLGDVPGETYLDGPFGPGTPGLHGNSRSKRMRTSFKHHQLRTMKSYFAINHNPDAKDLKQLSQKTGLPKRVLQVWFQNARAKWRRLMLKQEGKGGDKCGGDSPGDMDHGFAGPLGPGGPHSPQFILGARR